MTETRQRDDLAAALDGFWLTIAGEGRRMHGQIADPEEVADVLHATLSRIAAERRPDVTPGSMTGTTARIRWKSEPEVSSAAFAGYAGTFGRDLFRIYAPDESDDRWILVSLLPGADHRSAYGGSAEELKPIAERLLSEFASSLGAIFPVHIRNRELFVPFSDDEDPEPVEVRWAAGRKVRFAHPDAGYPGEGVHTAKTLTPGEVYTIGWADIGQSRTDLNLYRDGKLLGHFNSVLFEPIDDAEPVPTHPEEE